MPGPCCLMPGPCCLRPDAKFLVAKVSYQTALKIWECLRANLQVFGCFAYGMWRVACTIWPVMPVAVASVGGVWRVAPGHASGTLFGQLANDF